jgi:hypothetical protein
LAAYENGNGGISTTIFKKEKKMKRILYSLGIIPYIFSSAVASGHDSLVRPLLCFSLFPGWYTTTKYQDLFLLKLGSFQDF